jgi:oligopeptide/dipeptide ABC transporter ATP-binding protein
MASVPPLSAAPADMLTAIAGAPPDPGSWPPGCRFAARCALRVKLGSPDVCTTVDPPLKPVGPDHASACHFAFRTPEMDTISATLDAQVTATAEAAEEGILDNVGAASLDPFAGSPGVESEDTTP